MDYIKCKAHMGVEMWSKLILIFESLGHFANYTDFRYLFDQKWNEVSLQIPDTIYGLIYNLK